jgi:LysR family transcriptional regulator, transcriptional activator of the cysJI operon
MTLHQLRIFECVVKCMNITKASQALHISQPSVSQQLRLLEQEFGTQFLLRLNHGVELTAQGREFINAVKPVLSQAANVENTFRKNPSTSQTGTLRVGGSNNVSVNVLPKLLMAFKKSHPSAQFILETHESRVIETRLLNSELEIALVTNPSHCAEIVYETYEEMEWVAFCLPTNPLARKKLTLKELVDCPLVMKGGGRLEKVLMGLGDRMNVALRCEASSTVKAAVQMGMGVGILYRNAVATRVAKGDLRLLNVPELKEMGIKSSIIYDRRKLLTPMAQQFLQMLREKRDSTIAVNEEKARTRSDQSLSLH